jgi:hypothetical protein
MHLRFSASSAGISKLFISQEKHKDEIEKN